MSSSDLPIIDGSAKIIYTSHTIEHITDAAVKKLFSEAYTKLCVGGVFRITTGPDAETDYRALLKNDEDWFYWNTDLDLKLDSHYLAPLAYHDKKSIEIQNWSY